MKAAIIVSEKDLAGMNIKENLIKEGFQETGEEFENNAVYGLQTKNNEAALYTTKKDSVYRENIDKEIDADMFIFATRHQSAAGIHSFTVHPIGNFGKADFGGKEKTLCFSPAYYIKTGFQLLKEHNTLSHDVIQESTHHGPYLEKQAMFIEIGSSSDEWKNPKAGKIMAGVIIELLSSKEKNYKSAFGIGGLHHAPNFRKIITGEEMAISHICPKHHLTDLNDEIIGQAIEKSVPKAKIIVLDWKGLGAEKERIKQLAESTNLEVIRIK